MTSSLPSLCITGSTHQLESRECTRYVLCRQSCFSYVERYGPHMVGRPELDARAALPGWVNISGGVCRRYYRHVNIGHRQGQKYRRFYTRDYLSYHLILIHNVPYTEVYAVYTSLPMSSKPVPSCTCTNTLLEPHYFISPPRVSHILQGSRLWIFRKCVHIHASLRTLDHR